MKFHLRQFAIKWLLDPIPDGLKKMKKKKKRIRKKIIFKRILFRKINFGKGELRKINGSICNIPIETANICNILPRPAVSNGLQACAKNTGKITQAKRKL